MRLFELLQVERVDHSAEQRILRLHRQAALDETGLAGDVAPELEAGNQVVVDLALERLRDLVKVLRRPGGGLQIGVEAGQPAGIPSRARGPPALPMLLCC